MKIEELLGEKADWEQTIINPRRQIALEAARAALMAAESKLREQAVSSLSAIFMAAYADAAQLCEKMAKELE